MADIGHTQTDEVLERIEKRLAKEYAQAYKDVEQKAADYFKRFKAKDKQKKALVDAGKLSEKDYQTWRKNQMLSGKRWTDLRDQLAQDLTNTNQIAAGIVKGELNGIFAINANYSEYLIENGMRINYGFTLYDRNTIANLVANDPDLIPWKPEVDIPADLRWNRQMITSHITQGILQGESIPHLSRRLLKTVNSDKVAAVRTARTAVTSAQNAGRQMVYDRAKEMGLKLQKEWLATLDGRTRHEHGKADGQRVPLDGKFDVGGYKMKFPGDMSAPPHLTYNCRCTTITVEPDYITKGEEPRMTYDEWIEKKGGKDYEKYKAKTKSKENISKPPKKEEITQAEWDTLEDYVSGNGMDINNYLRGRSGISMSDMGEAEKERLSLFDSAMGKSELPEQQTLYRSVDASAIFTGEQLRHIRWGEYTDGELQSFVGKTVTDKGFVSTTKDKQVAFSWGDFTGSETPIVLEFETPKGTHGIDLARFDIEGEEQREVLLDRGLSYEVTSIRTERIRIEDEDGEYYEQSIVVHAKIKEKK